MTDRSKTAPTISQGDIRISEPAASTPRISWPLLIAYGMGGVIPIALFNIAGQLIGLLGNISLGLSAFWLGVIMIIPRLWDAVSDPIVGYLSDNTRSRWGRRRPFILIGGIAVALSFVAMWWVPRDEWLSGFFPSEAAQNWVQLIYILVGLLVFFTAVTLFEIPHGALGMEMSGDYHERTRLFSAKSFLGNTFAMGTPWLIHFAGREYFRGPGGDLTDGMRYLSMLIAAVLIPLTVWWFFSLQEPAMSVARQQHRTRFWEDMRTTVSNTTFLRLVAIIFTLAMGFNFVALFNYYITIFYLYGGSEVAAGPLLGVAGTTWAVTALIAVFPLNWLSRRHGKNTTLLFAILLMCAAQVAKIFCYRTGTLYRVHLAGWLRDAWAWLDRWIPFPEPGTTITIEAPYLVLIPTMLLSAGMLMFFTLGSSMVGDVCDEDELRTGSRSEGSFYAVYWWFIKLGSAFASLVTGALLVFTAFDERQNVSVNAVQGSLTRIKAEAEAWAKKDTPLERRLDTLQPELTKLKKSINRLRQHFTKQLAKRPDQADHYRTLIERAGHLHSEMNLLAESASTSVADPNKLVQRANKVLAGTSSLKQQTPKTLYRLRLVEIGLPLAMSVISILLTVTYPLTESRWREVKAALDQRHASTANPA